VSLAYHCDRDGCGTWQRINPSIEPQFYILSHGADSFAHFCCLDCVMHWTAQHSSPTETYNT
jgi:hypothetical protein